MKLASSSSIFWLAFGGLCSFGCQAQEWQDSFKLDYNYDLASGQGPDSWLTVEGVGVWAQYDNSVSGENQCDTNNGRPSPINLENTVSCLDIHEYLPRQISESDCSRQDLGFEVTPYGLRAYFPLTEDECERPTLLIPGRMEPYTLIWMELHARSEHAIEGKRYDAELQMVHQGMGQDEGQLVIISVMIEASAIADDLEFQWLLQKWEEAASNEVDNCDGRRRQLRTASDYRNAPKTKRFDNQKSNKERDLQFSPSVCMTDRFGRGCEPLGPRRRMFPYNMWPSIWYFGYVGSLAAPPCSSNVLWSIIDVPMRISRRQYKEITRLMTLSRDESCQKDTATSPAGENFRPLQVQDDFFTQFMFHCTPDDFGHFVYEPEDQ